MRVHDESTLISVIKLYYEMGISQEEIAAREYISKSTVSRLINKAVQMGYVKTTLNYPVASHHELEDKLKVRFGLQSAVVVPSYVDDYELRLRDTCRALIQDLKRFVQNGDTITLSWGHTMEYLARMLAEDTPPSRTGVTVVQSNGSVTGALSSVRSSEIVERFQRFFDAKAYLLPMPLLVDKPETATALFEDSRLKPIIQMARDATISLCGIGSFSNRSILFERGTMVTADYELLQRLHAVGDICSRYVDIEGNLVSKDMDARTLGLSLEELRQKPHRMAIAIGQNKVKAIIGGLRTGAINRFYTDEETAKEMLNFQGI